MFFETTLAATTAAGTGEAGLSFPPFLMIPVGIIVLWIGLGFLWNRKYRPARQKAGAAVASFNNILGRVLKFVFIEDKYPALKKNKDGELTEELKYPKFGKFLVWRNFYILGTILTVILAFAGNEGAGLFGTALFLVIAGRTSKVFSARHAVLTRMFEVAAVELRYPRDANLNPWGWVNIKKWERLTIPGDTDVRFPPAYKSEEQKNRENFERHFNGTVTDDNTWLYKWQSSKSVVSCAPVTHIPQYAPYPGSSQGKWNEIPIGLGTEGTVVWDVAVAPHALVTGTTGGGKLLNMSISVPTANGIKTVGDLKVGDTLFDPEGNPTKVTHLHPIVTPAKAYELTFNNGEKIIVDPDHLWETETRAARLSRFNGVIKEGRRDRSYWLSESLTNELKTLAEATDAAETISIPDVAELIGKSAESRTLYQIAKEIGVAEEVRPKVKFHYNAQIVKQKQNVSYVNSQEFMANYNAKPSLPSKNLPITQNQYDKLRELLNELRDSDSMTVESIVEYLNANKTTASWVISNFDSSIPLKDAVQDLYNKAEKVKTPWPDKIFSIDSEYINARQFASLVDIEYNKAVKSKFEIIKRSVSDTYTSYENVELIVPEKVIERYGNPYYVYPKRMFIERILQHNETPLNDQRHKRIFPEVRTTQEIFDTFLTTDKTPYKNHSIRKTKALSLPEKELPIAPYALGAWLGDGFCSDGNVCGIDHQVFNYIQELGYKYEPSSFERMFEGRHEDYRVVSFPDLRKALRDEFLLIAPRESVRIHGSPKHIPAEYLTASIEQRRELLRGLLDTDGTVKDNGAVQFATSLPRLRDDVKTLVASLGYIPFVSEKEPTYTYNGEKKTGQTAYIITFQAPPSDRLFHIDRKNAVHAERFNKKDYHSTADNHYIVDIREVEPVPMRCISVDSPTRLFAVGETMIPTHNSTIQRNLIFHCIQHSDRWRFLGIDVKRVELSPFVKYDPVVMGIATNVADGVEIIRYANEEMMNRYEQMEQLGVNHFKDLPEMPYALMVMIDESYMFLAPSGIKTDEGKEEDALKGEASKAIGDIARLGRAAGVHLVLATQRPDATVIYGELKQNLAARIAAGRMDSIASGMTLDNDNATRLPGNIKGRGYFQTFGEGEQFQGFFAPQDWIDKWLAGEDPDGKNGPAEPETPARKKERKSIMGRKKEPSSIEIDTDYTEDESDTPKKKKGGLLGKLNAYNESQARMESDDSKPAEDTKTPTEENPKTKKASPSFKKETPVVTVDEEAESSQQDPFSEDPFEDDPFADDTPLIEVIDSGEVDKSTLLNEIKESADTEEFIDPFGDLADELPSEAKPLIVSEPDAEDSFFSFDDDEDLSIFGEEQNAKPAPVIQGPVASTTPKVVEEAKNQKAPEAPVKPQKTSSAPASLPALPGLSSMPARPARPKRPVL